MAHVGMSQNQRKSSMKLNSWSVPNVDSFHHDDWKATCFGETHGETCSPFFLHLFSRRQKQGAPPDCYGPEASALTKKLCPAFISE